MCLMIMFGRLEKKEDMEWCNFLNLNKDYILFKLHNYKPRSRPLKIRYRNNKNLENKR